MKQPLTWAVAMLVAAVTFGGPAVANHEAPAPMIEGTPTPSSTPFCRTVEDARLIGEEFATAGRVAAKVLLATFSSAGLSRCGNGGGMVVPLELMDVFTAPDKVVMYVIRVKPGSFDFDLFLMTVREFRRAGDSA